MRVFVADGGLDRAGDPDAWRLHESRRGLRELVARRLEHLSVDANHVVAVASVIGREFELSALEQVADMPHHRLLEALDEARAARVIEVIPTSAGRYSFSHGLVQEAVESRAHHPRRIELHRRIAEALERLHAARPDAHVAELAYHFFEALPGGDVAKAIAYGQQAAERAGSMLAHEQAAEHYVRALQALGASTARRAHPL